MKNCSVYHFFSYGILPQLDAFFLLYYSNELKLKIKELFEKIFLGTGKYTDKDLTEFFHVFIEENISDHEVKNDVLNDLETILKTDDLKSQLRGIIDENVEKIKHLLLGYKFLKDINSIEDDINSLNREIEEIKLKLYVDNLNIDKASSYIQDKVQLLENDIVKLENKKDSLLNSKEVVAAYELHKITEYASCLNNGEIVETPTVKRQKKIILDKIASGQTVLLSGPVGTGKTKMAKNLYLMILDEKFKNNQITVEEYEQLKAIPIVNGNEETTVRELNSRPVQMSNRADEKEAFKYETGLVIKCLKYGLPLIIDEANRTPVNFLSSLKSYWSMIKGELFKDPITGEYFEVKGPLQVILTANEGDKYAAHTQKFQDQIEREISREYIGYLPENEMFDLLKAKTYKEPGISFLTKEDLSIVLPNLINSVMEINELYLKGEKYKEGRGEISQLENRNTVFDIKRFLNLVKTSRIDSKETFLEEINESIVSFISHDVNSDDERKILCGIFHNNCLLWNENIKDLVVGNTKLTEQDLNVRISTKKDQVLNIVYGPIIKDRFLNPWDFAVGYGKLINIKSKLPEETHLLSKFPTLGWADSDTKITQLKDSLIGLFHAIEDKDVINSIKLLDDENVDETISKSFEVLKNKKNDRVQKLQKFKKALETYDKFSGNTILAELNELLSSEIVGENDRNKLPLEEACNYSIMKIVSENFVKNDGAGRNLTVMKKIDEVIKDMKAKEVIKYENKDGGILTSITIGPKPIRFFEPDLGMYSDDEEKTLTSYSIIDGEISKNEIFFKGIKGQENLWTNAKLKEYLSSLKEDNLFVLSKEKYLSIFDELRIYVSKYYGLELSGVESMDLLFGILQTIGLFWMSDYNKNATRSCILYCYDFRSIQAYGHDLANASILLSDY